MMVKLNSILILVLLFVSLGMAQTSNEIKNLDSWENVKVVYEQSEVADLTQGKKMTETIKTSLNFGNKEKVKRNCLKALKKQAAEHGYSVIYVDQEATKAKRFNKRGIEVTVVGVGYKRS